MFARGFCFAITAALVLFCASTCQAKIRVVKQWYATGPDGFAWSHVKIETSFNPGPSSDADPSTITSEIVHPGTMTATSPGNKEIVTNSAHTIVAINFRPAVEATDLYLVVQAADGQLVIINNLNDRVAKLCAREHKRFDSGDVRADKIVGDKLDLEAIDEGAITYYQDVTVQVSPTGGLKLISYDAGDSQSLEKSGH